MRTRVILMSTATAFLLQCCGFSPEDAVSSGSPVPMYPDYTDITIDVKQALERPSEQFAD